MSSETEETCSTCKTNEKEFETEESFRLFVCLDKKILEQTKSKRLKEENRKVKNIQRDNILRKVSALRNSGGGALFVHMRGISRRNRRMGLFNEYVDTSLYNLIDDGSSFETQYFKTWYSDSESNNEYQYIVLTVSGSHSVSTADFKTKISLDDCIMRPTPQNIDKLLFDAKSEKQQHATLLGPNPEEECRNIQFKSVPRDVVTKCDLSGIIDYVWQNLRLPEYITSFSKLQKGGSYYIGIAEVGHQNEIQHVGIELSVDKHQSFCQIMCDKMEREMACFSPSDRAVRKLDATALAFGFHPANNGNFVIEIAVPPIAGCVFYDKDGPETYVMENEMSMRRLTFDNWIEKFETRKMDIKICGRCQKIQETFCVQCHGALKPFFQKFTPFQM